MQQKGGPREHGPGGRDAFLRRHVGRVAAARRHGRRFDGHDRQGFIEGGLREHQRASGTDRGDHHGQDQERVRDKEPRPRGRGTWRAAELLRGQFGQPPSLVFTGSLAQ